MKKELLEEIRKGVAMSFTRNGLALFGFDAVGMMFLQAATDTMTGLDVKQVGEADFNDGELTVIPLFNDWNLSQLTTDVGIKKLVRTIQEAMKSEEYSGSLVYEGSTKIQIVPVNDGLAVINFIYVRERNA